MGRKAPRTGASSASAASSVGGIPVFTSFAAATVAVLDDAPQASTVSEWDRKALVQLKAISKRDNTTRVRALRTISELLDRVDHPRPAATGKPFVNAWGAQFQVVASDGEPSIRAAAVDVMGKVVMVFRNSTRSILKTVLAAWIGSLGDSSPLVRTAAEQSLNSSFASNAVRRKLVSMYGEALQMFCISSLERVRLTGEEDHVRRALAVATWAIESSEALDCMGEFLDGDVLARLSVGVKVAKKGAPLVLASDDVYRFLVTHVVPRMPSTPACTAVDSDDNPLRSRATRFAAISLRAVKAGGSSGWDLMLSLLKHGLHDAFGNWEDVQISFHDALVPPAVATPFEALLPLLSVLPENSDNAVRTAFTVLDTLLAAMLPQGQEANSGTLSADGRSYTMKALPAYLECVRFSFEVGCTKWAPSEAQTLRLRVEELHLKPCVIAYLQGRILPPVTPHGQESKEQQRVSHAQHKPARREQEEYLVENVARAASMPGGEEGAMFMEDVASAATPIEIGGVDLAERLANLAASMIQQRKECGLRMCKALLPRLVEPAIATGNASKLRSVSSCHLSVVAALSRLVPSVTLVWTGAKEALVAFSVSTAAFAWSENGKRDCADACGEVLSWALVSYGAETMSLVESALFDAENVTVTLRALILTSLLKTHARRAPYTSAYGADDSALFPHGHSERKNAELTCTENDRVENFILSARQQLESCAVEDSVQREAFESLLQAVAVQSRGTLIQPTTLYAVLDLASEALVRGEEVLKHPEEIALSVASGHLPSGLLARREFIRVIVSTCVYWWPRRFAATGFDYGHSIGSDSVDDMLSALPVELQTTYCDSLVDTLGLRVDDGEVEMERVVQLSHVLVRFVKLMGLPPSRAALLYRRAVARLDGMVADKATASVFAATGLVATGGQDLMRGDDACLKAEVFLSEWQRIPLLRAVDVDGLSESFEKALRLIILDGESDEARLVAKLAVRRLVAGNSSTVLDSSGDSAREEESGYLFTALALTLESDASDPTFPVMHAVAEVLDRTCQVGCDVVEACFLVSVSSTFAIFRSHFEDALFDIKRDPRSAKASAAANFLTCMLRGPDASFCGELKEYDWFCSAIATGIRSFRRDREQGFRVGDGACAAAGPMFVARAARAGIPLEEEDVRFWSMSALDSLRQAQLLSEPSACADDVLAVADLVVVLGDIRERQNADSSNVVSVSDLFRHGAWAAVKHLVALSDGDTRGLSQLVNRAVKLDVVVSTDETQDPIDPKEVYRLVPLLGNEKAHLRYMAYLLAHTVGGAHLARQSREGLPAQGFASEEEEIEVVSQIIPAIVQDSLRFADADIERDVASLGEVRGFLAWILFLDWVQAGESREEKGADAKEIQSFKRVCVSFLDTRPHLFGTFFNKCCSILTHGSPREIAAAGAAATKYLHGKTKYVEIDAVGSVELDQTVGQTAGVAFVRALQILPAMSRRFVADNIPHAQALQLEDFVRRHISNDLISAEISRVREWTASAGDAESEGEVQMRGSVAGRVVWASYVFSEVRVEVALRLPDSFPLQAVMVDDSGNVGGLVSHISRNHLLSIDTLLRFKDGSIVDAIKLWRRNLDQSFRGVEECPICYSVLHLVSAALPKMRCRTCKNMFHSECLCKWFRKSASSACPMCRSVF